MPGMTVHTLRDKDDGDKRRRSVDVEANPDNGRVLLTFRNRVRDTVDVIIVEKKELEEALAGIEEPSLAEV
jgi:hypothetical protein